LVAKPVAPPIVSAEFAEAASGKMNLPAPVQLEVAFAGRSNVGKSTLLNGLMNRKGLARTSNTPGCTRTINFFSVKTRDGLTLKFVDLPGYGYAKRSKSERDAWADLIEGYLLERPTLRVVVILVDARRGVEEEEADLLELLESPPRTNREQPKTLIVATKLDKLPASAQKPALEKIKKAGHRAIGAKPDPAVYAAVWERIAALLND
jgi:GTP-binding protein